MCFLSSLTLAEWMLILTTVFTGGLLGIAWLAYRKLETVTSALRFSLLLAVLISLSGCGEKNTHDPLEVYTLWSRDEPPKEVHLIHGKYWQSSHWSKEYIMYLELQAPASWRRELIKQNHLIYLKDTSLAPDPYIPEWFRPTNKYRVYVSSGFNQGSVCYEDTVTGNMFLHEVQL